MSDLLVLLSSSWDLDPGLLHVKVPLGVVQVHLAHLTPEGLLAKVKQWGGGRHEAKSKGYTKRVDKRN